MPSEKSDMAITFWRILKHLRGELVSWEQEKLDLLNMDKEEMPAAASRIVKSTLDEHQVEPIVDALIAEGDAIIEKYEGSVAKP